MEVVGDVSMVLDACNLCVCGCVCGGGGGCKIFNRTISCCDRLYITYTKLCDTLTSCYWHLSNFWWEFIWNSSWWTVKIWIYSCLLQLSYFQYNWQWKCRLRSLAIYILNNVEICTSHSDIVAGYDISRQWPTYGWEVSALLLWDSPWLGVGVPVAERLLQQS